MDEQKDAQVLNINSESPSIQTHLGVLQNVIQRMAANSTSCKTWCITLVSAILVILAHKGAPEYVWIAMLPTALFAILDTYYLALERAFRKTYNDFVEKLHNKALSEKDLYSVTPTGSVFFLWWGGVISFSICGFYIPLALIIVVVWWFIRATT